MTLKTFASVYDLTQINIISIQNKDKDLSFILDLDFKMRFDGGNQVKTEFDMSFYHEFIFKNTSLDFVVNKPYDVIKQEYKNNLLVLTFKDQIIKIKETEIIIKSNVLPYKDKSIG